MERLQQIIMLLRTAPRLGPTQDIPEGTRNILISDTLATQIANDLQDIIDRGYV